MSEVKFLPPASCTPVVKPRQGRFWRATNPSAVHRSFFSPGFIRLNAQPAALPLPANSTTQLPLGPSPSAPACKTSSDRLNELNYVPLEPRTASSAGQGTRQADDLRCRHPAGGQSEYSEAPLPSPRGKRPSCAARHLQGYLVHGGEISVVASLGPSPSAPACRTSSDLNYVLSLRVGSESRQLRQWHFLFLRP